MAIKLIVGLGNIGPEYVDTRHNMGFLFCDMLASDFSGSFKNEKKFKGDVTRIKIRSQDVYLLKPTTYMNHSGEAVIQICQFYKILPSEILVVHDELDISPGEIKLKKGGGNGGHNGLKSIQQHLGTPDYLRLRVGIGHPGDKNKVTSWVLNKAPSKEFDLTVEALERALYVIGDIVENKIEEAMRVLHTGNSSS